MRIATLPLLTLSLLIGAQSAFAKEHAPAPATPVSSPGEWVRASDYPLTALRLEMTGTTAFRLSVDTAGSPSRCDIVQSSGFDMLDAATCQRLMANARFSPAHDRAGRPTEGTYSNRVRWTLPDSAKLPVSEHFASMLLSIDQAGNVTTCRFVPHVPNEAAATGENPCDQALKTHLSALGREFRGNFQGPSAEVEVRMGSVFTPALRASALAPKPGYEQRGLSIHRFTVTKDGEIAQCSYEELRGSEYLARDFCIMANREKFDPPFAAFGEDGTAKGWAITRVLLKTGQ
jgi:TonB family protein